MNPVLLYLCGVKLSPTRLPMKPAELHLKLSLRAVVGHLVLASRNEGVGFHRLGVLFDMVRLINAAHTANMNFFI